MRFKERNGIVIDIIMISLGLFMLFSGWQMEKTIAMVIAGLFLGLAILSVFTKYYVRITPDAMLFNRYHGLIAVPVIVDLKDIQEVSLDSERQVSIVAKDQRYTIRVRQAAKLKRELESCLNGS